ncbi:hypothetical protein [Dictyobacter kobayashii]|uniref:Uncharacterized protein n=1 Tax=Dictyobacter kobayashii TaxID=2014872 RepID=A0A402AHV8_9CHLR|nr:hypothetical protein [Dictyobacter kobayashii]GCE18643.1 hypothetical protein KDK_24430 [Dictyobacter kobayashii]
MKAYRRSNGSDIVKWRLQTNIQRDPSNVLLRCIPDFVFIWEDEESDPDLCLYGEAKRLFGTGASLAGKYVEEGLLDYTEGRYGRGHNYGIMIGYVLAAPLSKAVDAVKKAMNDRKAITAEISPFTLSNSFSSHLFTHQSTHLQNGFKDPMTIIHLFLDFS